MRKHPMSHIYLDCKGVPVQHCCLPGITKNSVVLLRGNMLNHASLPRSLLIFALLPLVGAVDALTSASDPPRATVESNAIPNQDQRIPTPGSTLTNQDVLDMLKAGLTPEIVVAKIKASTCNFDTSAATLEALKKADVPDGVIVAMVQAPTTMPASSEPQRPRIYVSDSQSWSVEGWSASHGSVSSTSNGQVMGSSNGFGVTTGGARPQTAEIIKTIGQRCPEMIVTDVAGKADYALLLDHEGGKGLLRHKNKVAVFNKDGDSIFSDSTITLGEAVEGACKAIQKARATSQQVK
jgi:hypothetical protein